MSEKYLLMGIFIIRAVVIFPLEIDLFKGTYFLTCVYHLGFMTCLYLKPKTTGNKVNL